MQSIRLTKSLMTRTLFISLLLILLIGALIWPDTIGTSLAAGGKPTRSTMIIEPTRSTLHEDPTRKENSTSSENTNAATWKNVNRLAASYGFTCALNTNHQAYCWGENSHAQLAKTASKRIYATPQAIAISQPLNAIAAGEYFACALSESGQVFCWGDNSYAQLGRGKQPGELAWSSTPEAVQGLPSNISAISLGRYHACALSKNAEIYCWGDNSRAQIGDGTNIGVRTHAVKNALSGITQIATGAKHTCALTQAGKAYCWGSARMGQVGVGPNSSNSYPVGGKREFLTPQAVLQAATYTKIYAGGDTSCAITSAGTLDCWGLNNYNQIETRQQWFQTYTPTKVAIPGTVTNLAMNWHHLCAETSSNQTYCWGRNDVGQLGPNIPLRTLMDKGDTRYNYGVLPGRLSGLDSSTVPIKNRAAISLGTFHTCILSTGNEIYCVGNYAQGQLGNGKAGTIDSNQLLSQRSPSKITLP